MTMAKQLARYLRTGIDSRPAAGNTLSTAVSLTPLQVRLRQVRAAKKAARETCPKRPHQPAAAGTTETVTEPDEATQARLEEMKQRMKTLYPPRFSPESPLAHRLLDGLAGLEIGAAAHNSFGLNTKNVGLTAEMDYYDFELHRAHQIATCGTWTPIDIPGYASAIPVPDASHDFVLHSHVWEHLPDPLGALLEWVRVVRHGGYIFGIVPKRDTLPSDVGRPVTPIKEHICHYLQRSTFQTRGTPVRGHFSVFDPDSLLDIELWFNLTHNQTQLSRVAFLETDDKVGNGHCIVWRVIKRHDNVTD